MEIFGTYPANGLTGPAKAGAWGARGRPAIRRDRPDQLPSPKMETVFFIMSYYVYILKSLKDGKYYIGSTSDVVARLNFHNAGLQRSTKSRIPFVLIFQETF